MPYTLQSTGETVEREQWRWEAHYIDGSVLQQFNDADQSFHQFAEIDQTKLHLFKMVQDNHAPFILIFPRGAKLVHKYINAILAAGTADERRVRLYACGYQAPTEQSFVAITPDNQFILTKDLNNIQVS